MEQTREIGPQGGQIFLNAGKEFKYLKQSDYFFEFELSDTSIYKFTIKTQYVEPRRVNTRLMKSERLKNDGRFVSELSHLKDLDDLHLMAIDAFPQFSNQTAVTITTRICKKSL